MITTSRTAARSTDRAAVLHLELAPSPIATNSITSRLELGDWDECGRAADQFLAESELRGPHYHDSGVHRARALLRAARGDVHGALEDQAEGLLCARVVKDPQVLYPALGASAYILADAGKVAEALPALRWLLSARAGAFR
jgi:hypothetical protein